MNYYDFSIQEFVQGCLSIANLDFLELQALGNEPQINYILEKKITLEIHLKKHKVDFEKA